MWCQDISLCGRAGSAPAHHSDSATASDGYPDSRQNFGGPVTESTP